MLGHKGSGRGRGSADYIGLRPFDLGAIRPPCHRAPPTISRLAIVANQWPEAGTVAELSKRFGAEADADAVRLDPALSPDECLISVWRWLAVHRTGHEWIAVIDADRVKPIDKFRAKLDNALASAESLVVALHPVNADVADAMPAGLVIAADVVGDFTFGLTSRRPLWSQVQSWCELRGRTIRHVHHLLHPQRPERAVVRSKHPLRDHAVRQPHPGPWGVAPSPPSAAHGSHWRSNPARVWAFSNCTQQKRAMED